MDRSTLGSSVQRYLQEFAQIHVHWAGDAMWLNNRGATALPRGHTIKGNTQCKLHFCREMYSQLYYN